MLSNILPFLQLAMPIIVSLIAAAYLYETIRLLLIDLCGTKDRARFWARCSTVALLAVPLMMVLLVVETPYDCETTRCAARALRHTLAWTAAGILAAIGVIVFVVGRYMPPHLN